MKSFSSLFFSLLMSFAVAANALDQDVQVDLLMVKIKKALKDGKASDALPSFAQLESMEPSLKEPLPEGFHFYYIDTLDKSGNHPKALSRANIYIEKFGRRGEHYAEVIEIMSRLQDQVAQESKAEAERAEAERIRQKDEREGRSPHCKELANKLIKLGIEQEKKGYSQVFERIGRGVNPTQNEIARWGITTENRGSWAADNWVWTCCTGGTWSEERASVKEEYNEYGCKVSYRTPD